MQRRPFLVLPVCLFLVTALAIASSQAEDASSLPAIPAKIDLQDGDTLVFLGDSITHQCLYTQYVEDFFYTRFPERRIHFHNAGIGGAQAWDALQRVSRDVLDYKPRYVTILLGMNDGRYTPFDPDIFATYQKDMTEIVARLREGGATPVLMSPTMFDARASRLRKNPRRPRASEMLSQYNSVLAYYGRWLQDRAIETGTSYVDMFSLLNDLTVDARKTDANFTLIKDSIHPDPPGQLVMAYAMIDDLGLRSQVSNIRILPVATGGFRAQASGGTASNVSAAADGVEFDWTANSLPWVLPEEAQPGAKLLHLGHRASKEGLEVHGLAPGQYEVVIDDVVVGAYSNVALSRHIELQDNSKTPQYQQALAVSMLNKQKNEGPVKQLRDGWRAFQGWARLSRQLNDQPDNAQLATAVAKGKEGLEGLEANIASAEAAAKKIEDEIYRTNQPGTRHYVIRKVK
ncbi:MAG: SGNH/GDSL hydrolase family protein [Fuerstiella sp.]|nr:SGNH/GDSL hydrolase family protein [Fuerstiella sp.]MCP4859362.1 SGNH/GDSL hydrolase family protein [Fuerstiella sp.]